MIRLCFRAVIFTGVYYFTFDFFFLDICADEQQFYLFRRPDELAETEEEKKH